MPKPSEEATLEAYQRSVASVWGKVDVYPTAVSAATMEPGDVAVFNPQTDTASDYLLYIQVSKDKTIVFPATRLITS